MFELRNYRNPAPMYFDPFREMDEMERRFFGKPAGAQPAGRRFRTDIRDNGDSYTVEADLPGVAKDDIRLELTEDTLTVRAVRHSDREDENKKEQYLRCERFYGEYSRSFDVSEVDKENIKAKYADGVLTLTLPKRTETVPETKLLAIEG